MTTELAPFQPKDEVAEWRKVYDALPKEVGAVITFAELDAALGRDFRSNRGPLYRAHQELLEVDKRALAAVLGKGYRIVEAREHEDLAKRDHRSGKRKIRRALSKVVNVDRSKLTPAERQRFEAMEIGLKRQQQAISRLETKVTEQQKKLDAHTAELDQLGAMRAQVERMEAALRQRGYLDKEIERKT